MKIQYCGQCDQESKVYVKRIQEQALCHETPVTYEVDLEFCLSCDMPNGSMNNLMASLTAAKEAYQIVHNYNSDTLISIREKFMLSRIQFAKVLGIEEKSIIRYENGRAAPKEKLLLVYKQLAKESKSIMSLFEENSVSLSTDEKLEIYTLLRAAGFSQF